MSTALSPHLARTEVDRDAVAGPSAARLQSLDVLRGLTVAGMILVTDPGTYAARYAPLGHAEWQGWTATDMIFPTFLWIVGVAIPFSLASRKARGAGSNAVVGRILRRTVLLILLGLALNGFPLYHLHSLRIPGILQRIAVCYGAAALLTLAVLRRPRAWQAGIAGASALLLLAVYAALLLFVPTPGFGLGHFDQLGSLPDYVDRAVFTVPHMWFYGVTPGHGVTYDSEGILSTLGALATTLGGVAVGLLLRRTGNRTRFVALLAASGVALVLAGYAVAPTLPIIKKLWTPSFALLACGVSSLAFAAVYALFDLNQTGLLRARRALAAPALVFGTNAIAAFTVSQVLTTSLILIHVGGTGLHTWLYQRLFATWLAPVHASLAYALAIVGVNLLVLLPLYRRRIFLRF